MRVMRRFTASDGGLEKKVALITGATSGIGRATALAFAKAGASVVIGDIHERPLADATPTADLIRAAGGRAHFVHADVTQKSQMESLVNRAVQEFDGIDVFINNAGIGHISLVQFTPDRVLRRLVEVNFYGVVYGVQAVLPVMRRQGRGHIINISSGAAMFGLPYAAIYAATKAAVMRFTEALRYELEDNGIRVSAVFPDLTSTELALEVTLDSESPTKTVRFLNRQAAKSYARLQSPEEVAQAVLDCVFNPRAEVYLTRRIRFSELFRCLFPSAVEREARLLKTSLRRLLAGMTEFEDRKLAP